MILQKEGSSGGSVVFGLVLLGLGILIGALARPFEQAPDRRVGAPAPAAKPVDLLSLSRPVRPAEVPEEPPENDLQTVYVDLDEEAAQRLQAVYDRSMRLGRIAQEEGDLVPATIRAGGKTIAANVRIKGDFLDHIRSEKWSLRVELDSDKLWGMSRFSIQHPRTRSYLWEWLFMQIARRSGLLAPRSEFVNVVMNGNSTGIYYLEEHFTKELLESQGKREGPILRFVEDGMLDIESQYVAAFGYMSESIIPAREIVTASVAAYGEKRLNSSQNLARQLQQGLQLMRDIRSDQQGKRTHELLDLESNVTYAALCSLFRATHALTWKSRRYYHNPVSARLEPIAFDIHAGYPPQTRDPIEFLQFVIPAYLKNPYYYNALLEEIGRISRPELLDECLADLEPQLHHFEALMRAEGLDEPMLDAGAMVDELRRQQVFLHELVHPRVAAKFDCRMLTDDADAERPRGRVEIEAWTNTRIPIVVEGVRLGDGVFRKAASLSKIGEGVARKDGSVVLPANRTHMTFWLRSNREREAMLRDVDQIKSAVLKGGKVDPSLKETVTVRSRLITDEKAREFKLPIRKFSRVWSQEGGRPEPPTLQEALDEHGFLEYDTERERLQMRPGTYDVEGDLVVPDGHTLHGQAGTRLRFAEGRALVTNDALSFLGDAADPIVLEPQEGVESWGGVAVLGAEEQTRWNHVHVRDTDVVRRGGWIMTGGVTFFESPVELLGCRFEDSHGEDALNIFGTEFLLDGIVIDGVASDAFDGDFVTGVVRNSTFLNSVEDAVDVSGSKISVEDCRFILIGDKGISAGENSQVDVARCVVESASIAVASKDFSQVRVDGLDIESTLNYGFAVYIKKAEFGPSTVVADNVTLGVMGRGAAIVQDTCALTLNGVEHETVPIDVGEMYRQKILGQ